MSGSEPPNNHGTILVVDDNFVNATLISHLVAKHGYAVETLGSGQEAVRRAAAGAVHGIFLDLHMPDMDGFDTARAIRAGEASSRFRVPIIAVTADLQSDLHVRALAAGMDDLLLKPVSIAAIAAMLERHAPQASPVPSTRESSGCLPICLPALDPVVLHEAEAACPGSASRLVQALVIGLTQVQEALPAMLARNGFLDAQRLVHQLHRDAEQVGSPQLAHVLADMESGLRGGDTVRCQRVLRALRAARDQFCAAIEAEGRPFTAAASAPGNAARPG